MNQELKDKWTAALRSGKYKQGRTYLHHQITHEMCCLGVLCEISDAPRQHNERLSEIGYEFNDYSVTTVPQGFCALTGEHISRLINLNDNNCKSFAEIADWIDENVTAT